MHRDLARAMAETRHRAARDERIVRELRRTKRLEARAVRRDARAVRRDARAARRAGAQWSFGRWWATWLAADPDGGTPPLAAVAPPPPEVVAEELGRLLERMAEQVVEHGTATERVALQTLADGTRWTAPGAAEALVDWEGTETARLRAFGILHGVVLSLLGDEDRWWLLERLRGDTPFAQDARVA